MAKRRGGRFKKMLGLGFISFEKAFSYSLEFAAILGRPTLECPLALFSLLPLFIFSRGSRQ
jgi:hypothetical protein